MLSTTLRQLDYACAIARHGGLTAAAEALHVSQPALSVALAQIERQLGQQLFLLSHRSILKKSVKLGWICLKKAL